MSNLFLHIYNIQRPYAVTLFRLSLAQKGDRQPCNGNLIRRLPAPFRTLNKKEMVNRTMESSSKGYWPHSKLSTKRKWSALQWYPHLKDTSAILITLSNSGSHVPFQPEWWIAKLPRLSLNAIIIIIVPLIR